MLYRMTLRSNPKLLIVPLVIALLFGLALAAFSAGVLLGLGGLAVAAYITYLLVRFVTKQLRCTVEVVEDAVTFDLYGEEKVRVPWDEVTHRGTATDPRRRRQLFLYRAEDDKLLVVPDEFEQFDALVADVAAHGDMMNLSLEGSEAVKDRLRSLLGGEEGRLADAEDSPGETTPPRS